MRRYVFRALAVLALIVWTAGAMFVSGSARAQEMVSSGSPTLARIMQSGTLKVGVNPLFKPFSFEKDSKRTGVDVDIAALLAEKLGVKLEVVVPKSFGELIPMVRDGRIDVIMAGMSITFDRAKVVDFTDPYFETGLTVMVNKGRMARLGAALVKDYEALLKRLRDNGKIGRLRVAVTKGKAPERIAPRFFPGARIVSYPSNEKAAEAVLSGGADLMVHDEMFLKVWLHDNAKRAQFVVEVFEKPFKPDYYGFAVAKGNLDFVQMLNTFILAELKANGRILEFMNAYIPVKARVSVRSYAITEDYYGGD